ncbi:hypothetical protein BW41_00886 [Sphingomonas sp. RIT328]|nr:hypothetical protein BW41_00886 [Sphingomonas sp. RIT328]
MSRMKLGLFGAARPSVAVTDLPTHEIRTVEAQDRLSGLTPIEIAAVEAMSQPAVTVAAR